MKKILLGTLTVAFCISSFASSNPPTLSTPTKTSVLKNFYFGVQTGASISADGTHFSPDTQASGEGWYIPNDGWPNRSLGTELLYGVTLGYQLNSTVGFDINYTYRNHFKWSEGQAFTTPSAAIYRHKTINDIKIQTVLVNCNFSPVTWNNLSPYLSFGLGMAFNNVSELQNTNLDGAPSLQTINGKNKTSFAWQAGIGVNYMFSTNWRLMLGYRFLDAGRLVTGNTITGTDISAPTNVQPFAADHPKFHELLLGISYQL